MRSTKFLTVFLISLLSVYSVSTAQIKVIAHRGHWNINATGSGNTATPQNSLASYKAADDLGAWGSEFDVNMTSDGQLVVCHGPKIVSLADVQKETFATVRGEHLSNGEAVPSLDELLQLIKKSKIRPILEVKEDYRDKEGYVPCFDKVAQALKKHRIDMDNLTIISFSLEVCKAAAKKYPKTMVQYLGGEKSPDELNALGIKGLDYHYSVFDKHPEWVKRAHDLGMEVNVWTVDKKRDIKRMAALGVDQITTNYPVLAQQIIDGTLPKKVLVIGAHPDDPETGCGGTMILMKRAGYDVKCVYLTRGEAGIEGVKGDEAAKIRSEEVKNACAVTGADHVFLTQIDGQTEINKARYDEMLKLIQNEDPDIVFTHWPIDGHRDHRICSILVYDSWRRTGRTFDLYYFEVMTGTQTQNFHPTDYVDITSVVEEKHKACYCHKSQNLEPVFEGWHSPMEVFRGIENRCKFAEAFIRQENGNRIFEISENK
ncbi:MAG: PIG-L family deacetylase [Bacteroidales bacterium]|nr:PIG-L family deacetylase [Bacteroidales bacterium]MBP5518814.1 PIG-L family deacetylase [Bacteroidales bacterium]